MQKITGHWRKIPYLAVSSLIFCGGFFLLIFRLNHECVWNDEAFTWAILYRHHFSDTWQFIINDVHPPLYYLMLKLFGLAFGNSMTAIRFFSVLGGLALAALGLGPVRRACGRKAGLLYSCMVFITPAILAMSQEGRMYSWAAFFVTGTSLYAYLAVTDNKPMDWVRLGLFTLGAAYIHYYALTAVVITHFLLLVWLIIKNRQGLIPFLIVAGGVLLCYLPWLPVFIMQLGRVKQDYWISPVSAKMIWDTFCFPFGDKFSCAPELFIFRSYAAGLAWVLILWDLWRTARARKRENKNVNHSPGLFAISIYLFTILGVIFFSYLVRPVFGPRYTIVITSLFILSAAIGLSLIPKKSVFWGASILYLLFGISGLVPIFKQHFNGPIGKAVSYLKSNVSAGAVFVHFNYNWQTMNTFCYYFPKYRHFIYIPGKSKNEIYSIFLINRVY
ncbi:MAG: glycosyltransferase family 39 protein [Firmicutes bacterium]|nr:glycosyltransferase family 39 protein [Bacillota bacterium]